MAKVFPIEALPARMNNLGRVIQRGATTLVKRVATGIGATVVDTTRVDTGEARSNWIATLNAPAIGAIPAYAPGNFLGISETANANSAKAQQRQVIRRYNTRRNRSVFITNRVRHIGFLNNGSSTTSADNMVEQGIQTGRLVVKATKILRV